MSELVTRIHFHDCLESYPHVKKFDNTNIFYKFGVKPGIVYDDRQCIMHCVRRNQFCTVNIENTGNNSFFFGKMVSFWQFRLWSLDSFKPSLLLDLPEKILNKFPHLKQIIRHEFPFNDFLFHEFYKRPGIPDYEVDFYDGARFLYADIEPLENGYITKEQCARFIKTVDWILDVEEEFNRFKNSRLFINLQEEIKKKQDKISPVIVGLTIFKLLRIGYSLYSGFSDNSNTPESFDFSNYSVDNLDGDSLDYITGSDFYDVQTLCDISFTGNDNANQIASLQSDLRTAQHNADFYSKEINNFTDNTSSTYRSTCISRLNDATSKIKDIQSQINRLK